jgi:hypothetical protein
MNLKKCVACINFWDCSELLPYAVRQWKKCGIDVMIVYSNASNYGILSNNTAFLTHPKFSECHILKVEPIKEMTPMDNERRKRNEGLKEARRLGYSHYISCDADELYEPFEIDWDAWGTVVPCKTYFKSPSLTIGFDTTLVPFIHRITPTLRHEFNRRYPFAWDKTGIRIDPTRQMNITEGVVFNANIVMHHYSYVRKDFNTKIENSTARNNIRKNVLFEDLEKAKDGYYCRYYEKTLMSTPNLFSLPAF